MTRYFLDVETTGLLARHADPYTLDAEPRIVSIAVVTSAGEVVGSQRVDPGVPIPPASTEKHRITDAMVADAPPFSAVWPRILARVGDAALMVAHNAPFDGAVLAVELMRAGLPLPPWRWGCTLAAARRILPHSPRHTLDALGAVLGLPVRPDHSALADARCAALLAAELDARDPAWCAAPMMWHPMPADGERVVGVTGHRHIAAEDEATVARVVAEYPACSWRFGGAAGVDTAALRAARKAGLSWLEVIVPGTVAQQPAEARKAIEECADAVVEMHGDLSRRETYARRNAAVVHDASEVLAFLDGRRESSGSRQCAEYARMMGRPVTVVGLQGRR